MVLELGVPLDNKHFLSDEEVSHLEVVAALARLGSSLPYRLHQIM